MTYCLECRKLCGTVLVDFGQGLYEFWGGTGYDENILEVSDCCEGDVVNELPKEEDEDD